MDMLSGQALCILSLVTAFQLGTVFSASCGQQSTSASSGYVSSPSKNHNGGFTSSSIIQQGNYPANTDCTYNINAPRGMAIKLSWLSFDLNGNMPDCNGDYVEIFIGCSRHSIGKYCSSNAQRPFDIYSPDSCMRLKFHSNSDNSTGTGFRAQFVTFSAYSKYRTQPCVSSSKRYSLMTGNYGTISSSNWPANYPVTYGSCYYKISVSSGRKTKIVFMHFNMASDFGCDKTKIKIKGGGSSYSKAHKTIKDSICGSKNPFTITTGEDPIHIRFKTESINLNKRGFIAGYVTYKPVSGGVISGSTAVVVGIIVAIIIAIIIIVVCCCVIKKKRERERYASANQAVSVPLSTPASYPSQPPPQQSYAPPPSYGQTYPPPGQEKLPPGTYPDNQAPYPQQGHYPPPGGQPYPPPGGQPYPPPAGQPYPPPGGQPYPPPGGQPYPPPQGQPYPPPGGQPYPPPGGQPYPPSGAPPYPT